MGLLFPWCLCIFLVFFHFCGSVQNLFSSCLLHYNSLFNNLSSSSVNRCLLLLLLSRQSCPTLRNPIDSSQPGSSVPGILQARILEWVAISFSSAWKWKMKVKSLSHIRLLATPWTVGHQAPPSMGFPRQEYWSGLPLPSLNPCLNRLKYSFQSSLKAQLSLSLAPFPNIIIS